MSSPAQPRALRHVVVLAHPDPHSFNGAMAGTYCDVVQACGQEVVLRDLYAIGFDPVLRKDERPDRAGFARHRDVADELKLIAGADVLALIYPIWFGTAPAILKGYVDRVLGSGVTAAAVQDRAGSGLLNGARLVSLTSSAARGPWLAEVGQEISLRNVFDHYLEHGFGMRKAEHLHFGGVIEGLSSRFVDQNLYEVRERVRKLCAAVAAEARSRNDYVQFRTETSARSA